MERLVAEHRLVTLTGAGGVGKTRLAVQVAAVMAEEFDAGVWYVDLAPITDPEVVPVAVARALGLPDQPHHSTLDTLTRFIGERQMLVVLDNCEHLLDTTATLALALLAACPGLTLLATSREPIGVAGEVTWRVPSLSLADEAIELFTDRARRVRPEFRVTDDNAAAVAEICRRLDGLPLAIELAAARIRALSAEEIVDGLHDRFRLLTGGARTAVRRQQTLRASVDWSHALLTEPERVLFRRLAVFLGGFDLDAAQAVAGDGEVERYQVLDELALLVDKSLVVAEHASGPTRYRLLETVRQYALEKLGDSGEADAVRARHRDHYTCPDGVPAQKAGTRRPSAAHRAGRNRNREPVGGVCVEPRTRRYRARVTARIVAAAGVAGPRPGPGRAGLVRLRPHRTRRAPAGGAGGAGPGAGRQGRLNVSIGVHDSMDQAEQALAIARELDDPTLVLRALIACGGVAVFNPGWPGRTSPRRSSWPAQWEIGQGSARSWAGRHMGRFWPVIRSRGARPAKKDATLPTRSATGTAPVRAAFAWVGHR